jgi:hypothetical protein
MLLAHTSDLALISVLLRQINFIQLRRQRAQSPDFEFFKHQQSL